MAKQKPKAPEKTTRCEVTKVDLKKLRRIVILYGLEDNKTAFGRALRALENELDGAHQ